MVDSGGTSKQEKRNLFLILSGLVVVAIILVIGIILVRQKNGQPTADTSEDVVVESSPDWYLEGIDEITDGVSVDDAIVFFQQRIDKADDKAKVDLYNRRINYITDYTEFGEYADQLIQDTIAIDEIEKTSDSAAQVVNTADAYGKTDIAEEYQRIMNERLKAEGIQTEGLEGVG